MAFAPFQRVRVGQMMPGIPALAYNSMLDAAEDFRNRKFSTDSEFIRQTRFGTIIKIKNTSGSDQDRFAVLAVTSGLLYGPSDNPNWFEQPCLKGTTPSTSTDYGCFVVLQEPIGNNKIGDALISGYTQVNCNVNSTSDRFADIKNSDATQLNSGFGSARILGNLSSTGSGKTIFVHLLGPGAGQWSVRGTIASDCAPDTSQTMTIGQGSYGGESSESQTISVRNACDCTIKSGSGARVHRAVYDWGVPGWEFDVFRTA